MNSGDGQKLAQSRRAEEWLGHLNAASRDRARGRLKIFLGMCAGVGKTFAMLKAAQAERALGREVVVGLVETHGRAETQAETRDLELLPRRELPYQGVNLEEFDLDAALARKPSLVLVDELAHTNVPGSRHPKRYQDVLELLRAGIDVFTTLNVQHLESRADAVASITGTPVRETVPDSLLDEAFEVQLIDLSPEQLLERLREGRVYLGERKDAAIRGFFKTEHLTALRELALRVTADRVDRDLLLLRKSVGQQAPWVASDRLLVAIGPNPQGEGLIRAARRSATQLGAPWIVAYVKDGRGMSTDEEGYLERNLSLARELGAEVVVRDDPDRVEGIVRTARERNVTRLLLGKPEGSFAFSLRSRWLERLFRRAGGMEIVFVPTSSVLKRPLVEGEASWWRARKREFGAAALIVGFSILLGFAIRGWLGYYGVGLVFLSVVLAAGLFLAPVVVIALSVAQAAAWNFFFIEPLYAIRIDRPEDVALCCIFLLSAAALGSATARVRLREERSRRGELDALAQADLLARVRDADRETALLRDACVLLERYFGARSTFLCRTAEGAIPRVTAIQTGFEPGASELAVATWCIENDRESGRWTDTLRDTQVWCCPLQTARGTLGAWLLDTRDLGLSPADREAIRGLASSLAIGLERIRLSHAQQEGQVARESARHQQNLLNSVSHEIRTPLTTVVGLLELWRGRLADHRAAVQEGELEDAIEYAREVDRILEDLVSLSQLESKPESLRPDWTDLDEIVTEQFARLARRYPDRMVENLLAQRDVVLVRVDARMLSLVVRNLLDNACKHTPADSRIRVRWARTPEAAELWVEDAGPGVPRELEARVFERFFRSESLPGTRGLGLGLSICQSFMERVGGRIRCGRSELGGAAFILEFPAAQVREDGDLEGALP